VHVLAFILLICYRDAGEYNVKLRKDIRSWIVRQYFVCDALDVFWVPSGQQNNTNLISGFRRHVDDICGLLGCYATSCGLLTREDGTDTLSRNVGKQLPHDAV
jgi:hypothetical protein